MNRAKTVGITALFGAAFTFGMSGFGGHSSAVTLAMQPDTPDSERAVHVQRASRGVKYQRCILHRESRTTNVRPNSAGASGFYQFTAVAWDATVQRMGRPGWAGRDAYTFTRAQQDAVYHAAWRQGNGRFYWSARWGAPYACFPGDVKGMR